jgi:LmbE family N-acetylglucosaminyl deacetylase
MTGIITGPREESSGLHTRGAAPRSATTSLRAWLDRLARLESRPDPLAGADRLLVASAHPDDETLGAGRLVAGFAGPAVAITVTAGERCLVGEDVDAVEIGVRRIAEWRSAVDALGAEALDTHRWPDGTLDRHQAEVARLLVRLAQPGDVLLVPWRHDPDRDHRALGRAAVEAGAVAGVRVVEYPVWAPYLRTPHEVAATGQALVPVDTDAEAEAQWRRALGEYLSQIEPWLPGWAPLVPADLVQHHVTQLIVEGDDLHP